MGPDEINLQVLREAAEEEVPTDWKRGIIILIFKRERAGELQATQSHLGTWQGYGADPPGKYAKTNGEQGRD